MAFTHAHTQFGKEYNKEHCTIVYIYKPFHSQQIWGCMSTYGCVCVCVHTKNACFETIRKVFGLVFTGTHKRVSCKIFLACSRGCTSVGCMCVSASTCLYVGVHELCVIATATLNSTQLFAHMKTRYYFTFYFQNLHFSMYSRIYAQKVSSTHTHILTIFISLNF